MPRQQVILSAFFTDQYKRFAYPSRSWFSIALAGVYTLLIFFSPIPLFLMALAIACSFSDDIPLTPIMSIITAINNLRFSRKTFKAKVMLVAVGLAVIAGGLVGFFVFVQSPVLVALLTGYIAITYSSPLIMMLGAIIGGLFAHSTRKMSAFWAVTLGLVIGSMLPIALPIAVEMIYIFIALFAFIASVITKQALRFYFYYQYGASNADGYLIDSLSSTQEAFVNSQAHLLGIKPNELILLTSECRNKIAHIKEHATLWQELSGQRRSLTNAYKNIYHALMRPDLSVTEVPEIKKMIANSNLDSLTNSSANKKFIKKAIATGHLFQFVGRERQLVHQFQIAEGGGLNPELLSSFR